MNLVDLFQQNLYYILSAVLFLWMIRTPVLARYYQLATISAPEAYAVYKKRSGKSVFLDIRTPWETDNNPCIKGSRKIPLSQLTSRVGELKASPTGGQQVIVVCHSGNRAKSAGIKLKRAGFSDVSILKGGMISWQNADYPVTKPKTRKTYG